MTVVKTALNAIQRMPEKALIGAALSAGTNTIYTCPSGKKARITGTVLLDNYGAASQVDLTANSIPFERWNILTISGSPQTFSGDSDAIVYNNSLGLSGLLGTQTAKYRERQIDITLEAGQSLTKTQNIGDNATLYYTLKVLELPA